MVSTRFIGAAANVIAGAGVSARGAEGGLIAEFSVDEAPQAALLEDIGRTLTNLVPDAYDVALALRD